MKTFDEKRKQLLSFFNTEEESIQKSAWVDQWRTDSLEKAEGSRGGKIIGHTKTGKPVYALKNEKYEGKGNGWKDEDGHKEVHNHFTPEDHADAHKLYEEHEVSKYAEKLRNETGGGASAQYQKKYTDHSSAKEISKWHKESSNK